MSYETLTIFFKIALTFISFSLGSAFLGLTSIGNDRLQKWAIRGVGFGFAGCGVSILVMIWSL